MFKIFVSPANINMEIKKITGKNLETLSMGSSHVLT